MCSIFSEDNITAEVDVITSPTSSNAVRAILTKNSSTLFGGAYYNVSGLEGFSKEIWLCPVTLFVLGKYPDRLLIL